MISIILAFAILWIGMYVCIKIINFIFVVFNIAYRPEEVKLSTTENESWIEKIVEAAFEYLGWADWSKFW